MKKTQFVAAYLTTAVIVVGCIVFSLFTGSAGAFGATEVVLLIAGVVFLLQGLLIVRPMFKYTDESYLKAAEEYNQVKESEAQLKTAYTKQRQINKHLLMQRKELEQKNLKLKDSETKLKKSTEEQLKINDQLRKAQEDLKVAYTKLQESEEEARELVEKQLLDNEKLFLQEKKMKEVLIEEQKSKQGLNEAMQRLKGAQTQLVHSEKMASLGQLTAGIAHEINNPINFISSGMNSMKMSIDSIKEILAVYGELEGGADPKELTEQIRQLKEDHEYDELMDELDDLIKDINYGVLRTIEIVKGLRVFSRLDEEEAKTANINENIDATLTLLKNKTKNRVKISKFYDDKMSDIECFPGQLNQVFMNILNNSIQAIPKDKKDGEVKIYTEEEKKFIAIRIKDNGVGIPDEIKARIWEPFFTTKDVGVGTGLGMSITFGIIEKHAGTIDFTSEVGKGTEFIIKLPKALPTGQVKTKAAEKTGLTRNQKKKWRVLQKKHSNKSQE